MEVRQVSPTTRNAVIGDVAVLLTLTVIGFASTNLLILRTQACC